MTTTPLDAPPVRVRPRFRSRHTLEPTGILDRQAISRLRVDLIQQRLAGITQVGVDLSAVTHCEPGLFRMLAWACLQMRHAGGDLVLVDPAPSHQTQFHAAIAALRPPQLAR